MFNHLNACFRHVIGPAGSNRAGRQRGAIAVFAAIVMVVSAAAAGAALDFARVYLLRERLQQTADAAALAANAYVGRNRNQEVLGPIAQNYFNLDSISPRIATVTLEKKDYSVSEGTFTVQIKGVMKTGLLQLVNIPELTVTAKAVSRRTPGPLEIAIAIDLTSSMSATISDGLSPSTYKTKLYYVKDAIQQLVDQLAHGETASNEADEKVRLGLVTFNTYVTVDTSSPASWFEGIKPPTWKGCVGNRATSSHTVANLMNTKFTYNIDSLCQYTSDLTKQLPAALPVKGVKNGKSAIDSALSGIDAEPIGTPGVGIKGFGASYVPSGLFAAFALLSSEVPVTTAKTPEALELIGGKKYLILLTDGGNNKGLNALSLRGNVRDFTDIVPDGTGSFSVVDNPAVKSEVKDNQKKTV